MKRLLASVCVASSVVVSVEKCNDCVVGTVSWCESGHLHVVTLFSFSLGGEWHGRAVKWLLEFWSAMAESASFIGGVFVDFPQLGSLLTESDLRSPIAIMPIRLEEVVSLVSSGVITLFGGQAVGLVLNFLLSKLRKFLSESFFEECPTLLRVSYVHFYM